MSDPLSVAGSAVGVISLGLVVCGEIVDYGRAYRDYDEDIRNITAKAESLNETLEDLKDAIKLTQTSQSGTALRLSNKVIGIKEHITRLKSVLKRYGPGDPVEGFARKARNQVKKSVYHFRKDVLREMAADLDSLQNTLQTALLVYSLKQHAQVLQEMKQMAMLITRDNGKIPPSLLRDCCGKSQQHRFDMTCDSDDLSEGQLIKHTQTRTTKRISSYSRWLGYAIGISFNITTGAGGFSICPTLDVNPVVFSDNPGFIRIYGLLGSMTLEGNFDDDFKALQSSIADSRLDPSRTILHSDAFRSNYLTAKNVLLFEEVLQHLLPFAFSRSTDLQYNSIMRFLLAAKERVDISDYSMPNSLLSADYLRERHVLWIKRLAKLGSCFDISNSLYEIGPHTRANIRLIVSKSNHRMSPDVKHHLLAGTDLKNSNPNAGSVRIICHENATELRQALREREISPNEMVGPYHSLLDWAFGWPEGVRILLEFGADPMQIHITSLFYPGVEYHSSIKMLLKAGGMFGLGHIDYALKYNDDEEIMLLLINELAARRKQLRSVAESFLPLNSIPGSMESKLLDGSDCLQVLDLLSDCKASLPHPFKLKAREFLGLADGTVYHNLSKPQRAKALYKAGFLDTDMLDSKGSLPLETLPHCDVHTLAKLIHWHISKGANIHRAPLWANESIALFLTWRMVEGSKSLSSSKYDHDHQSVHLPQIESNLQELIKMGDDFFAPTTISDGCSCPCSLDGCTAISVSLRECTSEVTWLYNQCSECRRKVFDFLQEWDQSYWQNPRAFIRSLTFNALDLNHTCFANTSKGDVIARFHAAGDNDYVNDNSDEQTSLDEFETLLEDLEQKFVESGQPLKEFLPDYWYRRVKDHLLTRQPDDENHLKDVRSVGAELEFCGLSVPEWMETCIARKVEELNDEGAVNVQRG